MNYMDIPCFEYILLQTMAGHDFMKDMNLMGVNGWELVSVIYSGGTTMAYLKRPIPTPA